MSNTFQPIAVETDSHDRDGLLMLADGRVVGLLVRLTGEAHDPATHGAWYLEAAFGRMERYRGALFASLDEAESAIADWLNPQSAQR
jgi:hypothetical protein